MKSNIFWNSQSEIINLILFCTFSLLKMSLFVSRIHVPLWIVLFWTRPIFKCYQKKKKNDKDKWKLVTVLSSQDWYECLNVSTTQKKSCNELFLPKLLIGRFNKNYFFTIRQNHKVILSMNYWLFCVKLSISVKQNKHFLQKKLSIPSSS